jgi:hypothetical protein
VAKKASKRQKKDGFFQRFTTEQIIIGTIIGATVLMIALFAINSISNAPVGDIEGIEQFFGLSQTHDETATYQTVGLPPVGGEHSSNWQNCGIYDTPVRDIHAVHSLEHGAVWLTYNPDDLSQEEIDSLKGKMRGSTHRLMSPYPGQNSAVVMSAWGHQLVLDSASDERIDQFIRKYEKGAQTPEPGAICFNGVGTPNG